MVLELGDTLRLIQDFTSDRERLQKSVDSIQYRPIDRTYVTPPVLSIIQACEAANKQSELVLNGLGYAAAGLSRTAGRKNLIWFTPGIPWLTDFRVFNSIGCLNDYTPQLHEVYARLASAQVLLYPIDPRGVPLGSGAGGAAASGPMSGAALMAFSSSLYDQNNSVKYLADATGGTAYFSRNDLAVAIGEVVASGSDYYSLAYSTPPSKYERYHTISVKVDRPGLTLRYREGYTSVAEKTAKAR